MQAAKSPEALAAPRTQSDLAKPITENSRVRDEEQPADDVAGRRRHLSEPVEVAKFWRNRRGEAVIVQLTEFEGRPLIDARIYYTTRDGKLAPTPKGLSISILKLPELAAAMKKAVGKATELGLLPIANGRADRD